MWSPVRFSGATSFGRYFVPARLGRTAGRRDGIKGLPAMKARSSTSSLRARPPTPMTPSLWTTVAYRRVRRSAKGTKTTVPMLKRSSPVSAPSVSGSIVMIRRATASESPPNASRAAFATTTSSASAELAARVTRPPVISVTDDSDIRRRPSSWAKPR
jgi:hypothetical protein